MDKVYNLQINEKNYKYGLITFSNIENFLVNYKLNKSIEDIIKEHKSYYNLKKILIYCINQKHNNRETILFILFNISNNEVCHIERLVYSNKSNSYYLDFIHTKKIYQKQGMGYFGLHYLIYHTKKKFKYYELKVIKENLHAVNLYTKHKFKIIKEIKQESKDKIINILYMVKKN